MQCLIEMAVSTLLYLITIFKRSTFIFSEFSKMLPINFFLVDIRFRKFIYITNCEEFYLTANGC